MAVKTWRPEATQDAPAEQAMKVDTQVCEALPLAEEALYTGDARPPVVWFVGAHGGSGASTLARVFAPMGDADKRWPTHDEHPMCVVVCRSTRSGLDAAQSAVLQAKSGNAGNCSVLGVVIVADAPGKTPKALKQRETVLEDLTPIWRVPYLAGIRENDVNDLAVWEPSMTDEDDSRRRLRQKPQPVTDTVPKSLAAVGKAIFNEAYNTFKGQEEEQ